MRGLIEGLAHGLRQSVPAERVLVDNVRREPMRYASDLVLYRHDPERYRVMEREDRLPSRVWWRWGEGRMPERLSFVHREHGPELERRYRERPIAERIMLGLAAGTGHVEEIERALDALRRRHDFPRRASFRYLVEGLPPGRVSQIAAGFLANRREAIEAYRRVRREHEREETEKRLRLLRELITRWGQGGIEIVPIFERLSARYSPAQQMALRRALEARDAAAIEAMFQRIEAENAEARTRALEAAFIRFAEEWEAAREGSEQTPMQELGASWMEPFEGLDGEPQEPEPQEEGAIEGASGTVEEPAAEGDSAAPRDPTRMLLLDQASAAEPGQEAGAVGRTSFVGDRGRFAPGTTPGLDRPRWIGWGCERPAWSGWRRIPYHYGQRWGLGGMPWYGIVDVPEYEEDDTGFGGIGGNNTTVYDAAPSPHFGGPPRPGRMAADGVYPFRELTRGMRLSHLAWLRNAYEHGHPWPRFVEIEEQRLLDAQRARERFFAELLEHLGCAGDTAGCSLDPDALAGLDALIADYTPEQKARIRDALTGGEIAEVCSPREVFRMCEAENLREHRVDREPLFMRFDGERDRVRLGNPALWALASQVGDAAGPFDGDLLEIAKAVGAGALKAIGGVEGLKQLGARALGALRGALAGPGKEVMSDVLPYVQRAIQGLGIPELSNLGVPELQSLLLGGAAAEAGEADEAGAMWDELVGLLGGGAPAAPSLDVPPPPLPDEEPVEPFAPEQVVPRDGPRRALTKATYQVQAGDWPQKIARKLGGSKRRRWLAELYRANPHKVIAYGNWRYLAPGEILNVPDEWSAKAASAGEAGDVDEAGEADAAAPGIFGDHVPARVRELLAAPRTAARDAQIVETLAEHVKGATQARLSARDDLFRSVLDAARAMYGDAFDPELLATGNPFLLFTHGMSPEGARALREGLMSGQDPLGIFRRIEQDQRAGAVRECRRIATALLREGAERGAESREVSGELSRELSREALIESPPEVRRAERVERVEHIEVAGEMPEEERPAPLFHLSLPPLHPRAFAALLEAVPALQMQPDAVKAEIAGWRGQSRDTSGVDAVTQEYVALPGESLRSIAQKLVGDGDRWVELDACNPARREGDPRLRIPPNWFAYIPYAAPGDAIGDLARNPVVRRMMSGEDVGDEAGSIESDRAALEALRESPLLRRILLGGGSVYGTTLRGLEARGMLGHAIRRHPHLYRILEGWSGHLSGWNGGGRGGWRGRWDPVHARRGRWEPVHSLPDPRRGGRWWETGEADGAEAGAAYPLSALQTLLAQIDARWPLRKRGVHDGLETYEHGTALRISEDARMNGPYRMGPDLVALSFVLRTDPRVDRLEIQKPSVWNTVDVPYLRVMVRRGPQREDPTPWDLSALDTRIVPEAGEAGAAERTYIAQEGETPQKIAQRFNVLAREGWQGELRAANPQRDWYARIHSGDVLKIPESWPFIADTGEAGFDAGFDAGFEDGFDAGFEGGEAGAIVMPKLAPVIRRRLRRGWGARHRRYGYGGYGYGRGGFGFYGGPSRIEVNIHAPEEPEEDEEEIDTGAGEGADRATLTGRTYAVVLNDYPQGIAKKLGAFPSRAAWWAELRAANPHKKSGAKGWQSLSAGEILNIPDEWPTSSLLRAAPGAPSSASSSAPAQAPVQAPVKAPAQAPPVPSFTGPTGPIKPAPAAAPGFVPLAATVDPGTISRIHAELAAWNLATPGACTPADFGRGPDALADGSGVLTERAQRATQSFQVWANGQRGHAQKLRSDGALDPATAEAIDTWFQGKATPNEAPRIEPSPAKAAETPRAPKAPKAPKAPRAPRAPGGPGTPSVPAVPRVASAPPRPEPATVPAGHEPPPPAAPPAPPEAPPAAKAKPRSASDDEMVGIAATLATVLGGFFL